MGRSRGNFHSNDEDPTQRSRRKKNAASGDNSESLLAGQGSGDGKRALYHCNYCNKDITGKTRIKCAMCPDFDLCLECFSVGAEVTPHKSNHPYRVMDNLSFPLICPDWNADEEILLLEGIEMYGLGNWAEIAEHVGTKSKDTCIDHYNSVYMQSQYFPLPDMSLVVGKNRKELLAMAKGYSEDKKGAAMLGDLTLKEESPFSPSRVKVEEMHKGGFSGRLSTLNSEVESAGHPTTTNSAATAANKKASSIARVKDGPSVVKVEDPQVDRNAKGKKPNSSGSEGPSLMELSGYNPKRQEFDPEYDNDAEQLLAEMEFKDTDTEEERELKLRVLHIYSKRLDERKRRKDFILERNLLQPSPFEKDLTPEERALCRRYDPFMRFHSKEEHEELLQVVVEEHRMLKRIEELKDLAGTDSNRKIATHVAVTMQEAQLAGCRTASEADRYLEQKRKKEAEENSSRLKDNALIGPSNHGASNAFIPSESVRKDSSTRPVGQGSASYANGLDTTGFYETQLLSETVSMKSLAGNFSSSTFVNNARSGSLSCTNNKHLIAEHSSFLKLNGKGIVQRCHALPLRLHCEFPSIMSLGLPLRLLTLMRRQEKGLCREIHLPPPVYLKMQEVMTKEIFSGNITKKLDAHPLFKIEASKVDRVYDMLVKKGIAQP